MAEDKNKSPDIGSVPKVSTKKPVKRTKSATIKPKRF